MWRSIWLIRYNYCINLYVDFYNLYLRNIEDEERMRMMEWKDENDGNMFSRYG